MGSCYIIAPYTISQKPRFSTQEQRFSQFKRRLAEGQRSMFGTHLGTRLVTMLARLVYFVKNISLEDMQNRLNGLYDEGKRN